MLYFWDLFNKLSATKKYDLHALVSSNTIAQAFFENWHRSVRLTYPKFSWKVSKTSFVVVPVNIKINTSVKTTLDDLWDCWHLAFTIKVFFIMSLAKERHYADRTQNIKDKIMIKLCYTCWLVLQHIWLL